MGIFLILLIIVIACWPWISRWLRQFLANRTEDYLRKATGMPPRPGSREDKRRQRSTRQAYASSDNADESSTYSRRTRRQSSRRTGRGEPIIPREYAEDVEFVETKSFSETVIGDSRSHVRQYHESQVSDAEWVEIRSKK